MEEFDIDRIKKLAGLSTGAEKDEPPSDGEESPLTHGASDKGAYMKQHKIEPGSNEWFKLWNSHPKLSTNDNPYGNL